MNPLLSVLIPSVPSRLPNLPHFALLDGHPRVEVLCFTDNKRRPVGAKRQALLDMARGDYVAFVDDDDDVSLDYLAELLPRMASGADVITFEQDATIDGVTGRIVFSAECRQDEPWLPNGIARRRPWHVCAWKRSLAVQGLFTEINYYEDLAWVEQVAPLAKSHLHIPKVLHFYRHNSQTTEAPHPG